MITMKDKICNAALELFIKKGYENVSLREIADTAGTTIGNLTYHFPHKDLLLASLQERVQNKFPICTAFSQDPKKVLEQLIDTFFLAQKNEIENPYYYENVCEFYTDSPSVRANITSFREKLFSSYYIFFSSLRDLNVMNSAFPSEAYLNLTYLCVFMTSFWASKVAPSNDPKLPNISLVSSFYHLLLPYIDNSYLELYNDTYERVSQQYGFDYHIR